jgi:cytochrome c oxidase subunit 2
MVVPAGAVVKLITTSNDVIHSFALPAAWVKMDAVPGSPQRDLVQDQSPRRLFRPVLGTVRRAPRFMPIAVEVVPAAQFAQWIAFKGGTIRGAKPMPQRWQPPPLRQPAVAQPTTEARTRHDRYRRPSQPFPRGSWP